MTVFFPNCETAVKLEPIKARNTKLRRLYIVNNLSFYPKVLFNVSDIYDLVEFNKQYGFGIYVRRRA